MPARKEVRERLLFPVWLLAAVQVSSLTLGQLIAGHCQAGPSTGVSRSLSQAEPRRVVPGNDIGHAAPRTGLEAGARAGESHASAGAARVVRAAATWHTILQDMGTINTLLFNHDKVSYQIQEIPDGVRTITTSTDPDIVAAIQLHSHEMAARMEQGNVIRPSDPIFRELFLHHAEVQIQMRDVPNGTIETEISKNPQVVLLIRAHSKVVAAFVREGMPRTRIMTSLPPGYHAGNGGGSSSSSRGQ